MVPSASPTSPVNTVWRLMHGECGMTGVPATVFQQIIKLILHRFYFPDTESLPSCCIFKRSLIVNKWREDST